MNRTTLLLFKSEFWKDKRKIEIVPFSGSDCLLKHYDSDLEMDTECSIIEHLIKNGIHHVPRIYSRDSSAALMSYIKGIRVFNLFVVLDEYSKIDPIKALHIKRSILNRCEQQQKNLQNLLLSWKAAQTHYEPYPSLKLETAVSVLSDCLDISYDYGCISKEIRHISDYMAQHSVVPFRDSTTKNMILSCDDLFLRNYSSESERDAQIFKWIDNGKINELLASPIIDIDFSSCINDTTPEDDVIGLKFHQRTWDGSMPNASDLVWNFAPDPYRAAISFMVRFYRFGSRKASYKLLHKETAAKRFKYDDSCYYFDELPKFVNVLCPDVIDEYPAFFDFNTKVYKKLTRVEVCGDYFRESDLYEKETPYVDVFPN